MGTRKNDKTVFGVRARDSGSRDEEALERSVRSQRKFSLTEAIGRMGGSGLIKGESPVDRKRQAEAAIDTLLERYLVDAEGAMRRVLSRRVSESRRLIESSYTDPRSALSGYCERLLDAESRLEEFVTEVDAEWGRMYLERPYFQQPGQQPHPDDPYTFSSVRDSLSRLLERLAKIPGSE